MKCIKCGREMGEGKRFCTVCGAKLEHYPTSNFQNQNLLKSGFKSQPLGGSNYYDNESERFRKSKYLFNQQVLKIVEKYDILDENGTKLFFVRRKFFALKRDIYIFEDETERKQLLTIKQDSVFQYLTRPFSVYDEAGKLIARIIRDNIYSIIRRRWRIILPDGTKLGVAIEDSFFKSFLRRFMPMGEILKTDFIIIIDGQMVGKFIRKWTLFDRYVLDLSQDAEMKFDRRIAISVGVLLDTGERR